MKKYIIGYGNGDTHVDGRPWIEWDKSSNFRSLKEAIKEARQDQKDEQEYQKELYGEYDSDVATYIGKYPMEDYDDDVQIVYSIEGKRNKECKWKED